MAPLSTAQVANQIGIHRATLEEWLSRGKVKSPRTIEIGNQSFGLWRESDIARLEEYKSKFYCRGRGRKKKIS